MAKLIYLNSALMECTEDEAVMKILDENVLHIWRKIEEHWIHANPFSFGAIFPSDDSFSSPKLLELQQILTPYKRDPYAVEFPYVNQVRQIQIYGPEEINVEIPEVNAHFLAELYERSFPIFWQWAINENSCVIYDGFYGQYLASRYEDHYSATSYEEFVTSVFGVARKDTLRTTRSFNIDQLAIAYVFKNVLPVDVILDVLLSTDSKSFDFEVDARYYQALNRLSSATRRRLMEAILGASNVDPFAMRDSLTMLLDVPEERLKRLKGVRDWDDLHDRTMRLVDVDAENEAVIQIPGPVQALAKATLNDAMQLVPLMRAQEFISVGDTLDICLGKSTYFTKARHGESYSMTGLVAGEPKVAIELERGEKYWRVLQFRGYDNSKPSDIGEKTAMIEAFLNAPDYSASTV